MKRLTFALLLPALLALGGGAARGEHIERDVCPVEPTREFPAGFRLPVDNQAEICRNVSSQWADEHVGGWGGGDCPADHKPRTPVILVHGNTGDAWFWRAASETSDGSLTNVRERFIREGYCPRELWAITYSGDASPRGAYGSGYTTYNDVNAEETWEFILAVRDFTGAPRVDVVGHSLGVTVVRKALFLHRRDGAYDIVRRAVMIAGGNHGTTTCRGSSIAHYSHVCDEVEPGSTWLGELNAPGESPGPTKWMSVCDCSGVDQFYEGPDVESPLLAGSVHVRIPYTGHISLARGKVGLDKWVPFLEEGTALKTAARPRTSTQVRGRRSTRLPATGVGVPVAAAAATLGLAGLLALGLFLTRRRDT